MELNQHPCKSFWGLKWLGCEVDGCPTGAKVKNELSYTSSPLICLHGKYGHNFTFINLLMCQFISSAAKSVYKVADIM